MSQLAKHFVVALTFLLAMADASTAPDPALCSALAASYSDMQTSKRSGPARAPTPQEKRRIDKAKIDLLDHTDYGMGLAIVDADNDGIEDLAAWNIDGTGRFVHFELFHFPSKLAKRGKGIDSRGELELGVLRGPEFLRVRGVNYIVSTDTGDDDGISISQLVKAGADKYLQQTVCRMQTVVHAETACRHPACKQLKETIEDTEKNGAFRAMLWPHKYTLPAGLDIYFPEDRSEGDFDNTGKATSIWRFGREGYDYQHIYWALLGEGAEMPEVDPKIRPTNDEQTVRRVLPGRQHDRLRASLAQQSEALSKQLRQAISLPTAAEFFLFQANGDKTYWAWDFGSPPEGHEIHITYTKGAKSDYVGMVRVTRKNVLMPCLSNCTPP